MNLNKSLKKSFSSVSFYKSKNNSSLALGFPESKVFMNNIQSFQKNTKKSPFRKSLAYKFYKLLKPKKKMKIFTKFPLVEKNGFNFDMKDQNETINKKIKISEGNRKHIQLAKKAYLKELEKKRNAKQFILTMKLIEQNRILIKEKDLKEKQKMNEIIKCKMKLTKKSRIERVKSYSELILKEGKNKFLFQSNNKEKINEKNESLLNKYKEIMDKIRRGKMFHSPSSSSYKTKF